MGMEGYPQYLPGVMKIQKICITERGKTRNFRKTSGKDKMGVVFFQNHKKYSDNNKKANSKGESHCSHFIKQDNLAAAFPEMED